MTRVLLALIAGYQRFISPLSGPRCGYYPTCSHYAAEAVQTHGALRGTWLAMRRIARCNPWTEGGVDMVPDAGHYRWWGRSSVAAWGNTSHGQTSLLSDADPSASPKTEAGA